MIIIVVFEYQYAAIAEHKTGIGQINSDVRLFLSCDFAPRNVNLTILQYISECR